MENPNPSENLTDALLPSAPAMEDTKAIPAMPALPWIGAPRSLLNHPGLYLLQGYRRHGPVFGVGLFGMRITAMIGPDANQFILVRQRERFSNAEGYRVVRELLGDGLLFQDGAVHQRNRRLMTPALHTKGVQRYFEVMHDCIERHTAEWSSGALDSMYERMRHLTFEIMARLVLGVRDHLDLAGLAELNDQLALGAISFPRLRWAITPYGRGLIARDKLREYLRSVIRSRRGDPGTDALGLLMGARDEDGDALSEEDLLEQAVILMFAGHETTASMLTSFLTVLKRQPALIEALIAEQVTVFGDAPVTVEKLKQLDLLDRVFKEVERMHPPLCMNLRGVLEDTEFQGYLLKKGTVIAYSSWATHRLESVFQNPDKFDPERFAEPRSEHRKTPCGLIGFGAGPRLCIGQAFSQLQMKTFASVFLRRYHYELSTCDPVIKYVPSLHPVCGLPGRVWKN